jgi:hypothetical protein
VKIAPPEITYARNHGTRSNLPPEQSGGKPPHCKMFSAESAGEAHAYHLLAARNFKTLLLR